MHRHRISTTDLGLPDPTEAFREQFGRTILRIHIDPLEKRPLASEMSLQALPGLGIASGRGSPMLCRHSSDLIDNDDLVVVFIRGGYGVLRQNGRSTDVPAGAAVLTDNGEPASFAAPAGKHVTNVRFDRARLAEKLAGLGGVLRSQVLTEGPALALMAGYVQRLESDEATMSAALQTAVVSHLYDLAALALGATPDAADAAMRGGVRAARLAALKEAILAALPHGGLSLDAVARAQGISPTYARQLFAQDGTTFTDFVLERRLALAHRMLTDAALAHRTISEIAFECGFGDLSYFNRTFRRRYDATPSDVRESARALRS